MTMAACYASYETPLSHGLSPVSVALIAHQQPTSQLYHPTLRHSHGLASTLGSTSSSALLSKLAAEAPSAVTAAVAGTEVNANTITASNLKGSRKVPVLSAASSTISPTTTSKKDYTIPLHVDCSVEYELPNQPKPPVGQRMEPLLMIHPCYFRKIESQRRSPFVNNMQATARSSNTVTSAAAVVSAAVPTTHASDGTTRRCTRQSQVALQKTQQPQHCQAANASIAASYQQHLQQQLRASQTPTAHQTHFALATSTANVHFLQNTDTVKSKVDAIDHPSAVHRSVAGIVAHSRRSTSVIAAAQAQTRLSRNHNAATSQSHHSQMAQKSSQWNHLAAAAVIVASRSCMTPVAALAPAHSGQMLAPDLPASHSIYCNKSVTTVGKRDAMISGGLYGSTQCGAGLATASVANSKSLSQQQHQLHHLASSLPWGPLAATASAASNSTSATSASTTMIMDRSPMATIPSNYQAGPDSTPTLLKHNQSMPTSLTPQHFISGSSSLHMQQLSSAETVASLAHHHYVGRDVGKLSGKYRQYLRTQRLHPYLAPTSSATAATHVGQSYTPFTSASTAATIAATHTFQLQPISCFNI